MFVTCPSQLKMQAQQAAAMAAAAARAPAPPASAPAAAPAAAAAAAAAAAPPPPDVTTAAHVLTLQATNRALQTQLDSTKQVLFPTRAWQTAQTLLPRV